MSQPTELTAVVQMRFCCRHIHADGSQCGSPALRGEQFCYFHHITRRPKPKPSKFKYLDAAEPFTLAIVEDRVSALSVASQILCRIASNDLDPARAATMLYNLQVLTAFLPREPRPDAPSASPTAPVPARRLVEELVLDEVHGPLAPIAEILTPEPAPDPIPAAQPALQTVIPAKPSSAQSREPDHSSNPRAVSSAQSREPGHSSAPATAAGLPTGDHPGQSLDPPNPPVPPQTPAPAPPPLRDYNIRERIFLKFATYAMKYDPDIQTRPASITDADIIAAIDDKRRLLCLGPIHLEPTWDPATLSALPNPAPAADILSEGRSPQSKDPESPRPTSIADTFLAPPPPHLAIRTEGATTIALETT